MGKLSEQYARVRMRVLSAIRARVSRLDYPCTIAMLPFMRIALVLGGLICGVATVGASGAGAVETVESYCSKAGKIVLYPDKGMMSVYTRSSQDSFRYIDDAKFVPFGETYRPVNGGPDEAIYRAESIFAAASPKSSKLVIFRDRVFWPCEAK